MQDVLVQKDNHFPVIRKFGHAFLLITNSVLPTTFLTEVELRQLHRRFGHPSVNRLTRVLQRSGHENDSNSHRKVLERIGNMCKFCQKYGKSPGRFKFNIKRDISFNHTILVDVMYINGDPVLRVIDEATRFQAAKRLPNMTALATWNAIRQCWIDIYIGPPDIIAHDSGTNFVADKFQKLSTSMGIVTKCAPVESHNSMGLVERYHSPIRRAYQIIAEEFKEDGRQGTHKSMLLQMAIKAVNDTAGPDGLTHPPAPTISQRAKAIKTAMVEVSKLYAQRQVSDALKSRNGPRTDAIHALPIGADVLVWRIHEKKWNGPYKLIAINGETCTIKLPNGNTNFRSTSVKPYNVPGSMQQISDKTQAVFPESPDDLESPTNQNEIANNQTSNLNNIRRNPGRSRQLPSRFRNDIHMTTIVLSSNLNVDSKPSSFAESRRKEINGLLENGVFEIYNENIPARSRVFKTRFVDQIKHEGTLDAYHKSRLVVQAYNDAEKKSVLTQAPTIQRASQRLLLCFAMMIPNIKVAFRDISQAYTQSNTSLERNIFVRPVPELGLPSNTLLRIARPLYGIPEAGTHWFNTYQKHHIEKLFMQASTFDSCLLYSKHATKHRRGHGIIGLQTDDTLIVADDEFLLHEKNAIKEAGFLHKPLQVLDQQNSLNFNGSILRKIKDAVQITQKKQIDRIQEIDSSLPNKELKVNYLSQRARGAYVATVSQLEAAFAVSKAAQVTHPTEEDIKFLNEFLLWQKENAQRGLKFVQLDINTIRVVVLTDSSFANNEDYSSQIGYVILLVDDSHRANLIHWSSIKCQRMTRSVLAGELYALVNGFDLGSVIKTTAENALRPWHPEPIPLVICTDSQSLYDCLVKLGTTNEKRLMIDIMCLQQAYERREITEIIWIPGDKNPADAMTKEKEKCSKALRNLVDENKIELEPYGWVQRNQQLSQSSNASSL
ncbi:hypothetical protein K3495_g11217 [Podosphaera aphanis]|nr:hypothetical protein K3495_g11217 [Podosphaera aphanis]